MKLKFSEIKTESDLRERIFYVGFFMLFFGLLATFPDKPGIAFAACGAFLLFVAFYKRTGGAK